MIQKHEIPLLEFDTDEIAVIQPTHEHLPLQLPKKAVYAFLGEHIDAFAAAHHAEQVAEFVSETKKFPIYVVPYQGESICLCQAPVGSAPAAQIMDWLIGYGVREIITGGCCGDLVGMAENVFLIPKKALRDEGTSYHYLSPSRYVEIDHSARCAIAKTLHAHGLPCQEVVTWTTDGFYRETAEKVAYRKAEGCQVVEMECAALAAVAAFRHVVWGALLFTADTLANVERYDARSWGEDSFTTAVKLCMDVVLQL